MRFNATDKEAILSVKNKIEQDLSRHFTITELASEIGMNPNKLKSGFKIMFGKTIYQFLMTKRMIKAKDLIHEDRKSLGQIAKAVGFRYLPNFVTAFKKYYGQTPGQFLPR